MNCPVCGHPDGACRGTTRTNERQIITASGIVKVSGPQRVPRPRVTRLGREGYIGDGTGKLEYYDTKAPNIRFVDEAAVTHEPAAIDSGTEEGGWTATPGAVRDEASDDSLATEDDAATAEPPTSRRVRRKKADT